jgi:ribosome recycling factor
MEPDEILLVTEEKMDKAIAATQNDLANIRTGRANPLMLERIQADYYGTPTAITQMANISVQGGQTLVITPYDKTALAEIEKAIAKSDLNLPPQNDGNVIRLNIPPLTEETRKEQVKQAKKLGEDGKVALRNIRRDGMTQVERVAKEANLSEDDVKAYEDDIDKLAQDKTKALEGIISTKEEDLMAI